MLNIKNTKIFGTAKEEMYFLPTTLEVQYEKITQFWLYWKVHFGTVMASFIFGLIESGTVTQRTTGAIQICICFKTIFYILTTHNYPCGTFTDIWLLCMINVSKHTIHGSYGLGFTLAA